jgi:predicted nucleotidyltransferase
VLLEGFVAQLRAQLGDALHAVWLFGSRARGEQASDADSDVDVLVLVDDDSWEVQLRVRRTLDDVGSELGLDGLSPWFSVHVNTPEWLAQRRAIKSFFIAEVDRDKIVVEGSD